MPEDTYTLATSHLTDFRICLQLSKGELLYIKESIESAYKKYSQPNKDSYVVDFKETYNNEVTPERKTELEKRLSEIESVSERIKFLELEKLKYLQGISPETLFISGMTLAAMGKNESLFFDRHIELEIQKEKIVNTIPQQTETKTEQETPKTLSDLITHHNSIEIIERVKIQYKNIKGKRLKLLMLAFQDLKLLPKERVAQKFYDCCKKEFDWDIASYNAMNGYDYNDVTDSAELQYMKQFIEKIIKTK
jgi:hypothetical protein